MVYLSIKPQHVQPVHDFIDKILKNNQTNSSQKHLSELQSKLAKKLSEIKQGELKALKADSKILTSLTDRKFEVKDNRVWSRGDDGRDKWTYKQMQL